MNRVMLVFIFLGLLSTLVQSASRSTRRSMRSEKSPESVIDSMIAGMTLEEKVGQLGQLDISMFINEDGTMDWDKFSSILETYKFGSVLDATYSGGPHSDGSTGWTASQWRAVLQQMQTIAQDKNQPPIIYGLDSIHGATYVSGAALFPAPLTVAASFDPEVARASAVITAKDTLAAGINWIFSPVLGLALSPSWARFWETYGEDPLLTSRMGAAMIEGLQAPVAGGTPSKAAACMKHFIAYSAPANGHDRTPVTLGDREVQQLYKPAFRAAVESGVMTGMESYNEVNGIPMIASERHLRYLLRGELRFQGPLVSDFQEIENLYLWHKVVNSTRAAVKLSFLETSIDMSMIPSDTDFFGELVSLVKAGEVPETRIDASVRRVLKLKQALGMFEEPIPSTEDARVATVGQAEDQAVALDAARKSMVLLKNDDGLLPVASGSANVFITGPTADSLSAQLGGWALHWQGPVSDDEVRGLSIDTASVLDGVRAVYGEDRVNYIPGPAMTLFDQPGEDALGTGMSEEDLQTAVNAAAGADIVFLCLGEGNYAEKPGDIDDLRLPGRQLDYARAIAGAGTPVVLVLVEGRPRLLDGVAQLDGVKAVLFAGVPGPQGGQAVAETLAGWSNPAGRLPFTYPQSSANVPYPYHHKPSDTCNSPDGSGYINCPVEWAFGSGLSYTSFEYSPVSLSRTTATEQQTVEVTLTVTNTGSVAGDHSVLLFLTDVYRRVTPEYKLLKNFIKLTSMQPGEARQVAFQLSRSDFVFAGPDGRPMLEAGEFRVATQHDADCRADDWANSGQCSSFTLVLTPLAQQNLACDALCHGEKAGSVCHVDCISDDAIWPQVTCDERTRSTSGDGLDVSGDTCGMLNPGSSSLSSSSGGNNNNNNNNGDSGSGSQSSVIAISVVSGVVGALLAMLAMWRWHFSSNAKGYDVLDGELATGQPLNPMREFS